MNRWSGSMRSMPKPWVGEVFADLPGLENLGTITAAAEPTNSAS